MENNVLQYLDDPAKVVAELKEKHRPAAKIAVRELGNLKKAEDERRNAVNDINRKYPQGVPTNARLLYDAIAGTGSDGFLAIVQDRLLRWDNLSAHDVSDIYGRWPTDLNRLSVLDHDLAFGLALANKAGTVRENIKKLYSQLAFEESENKRLGVQDETWTVPTMMPVQRDVPVTVVTGSKPLR
jgi:hypothetical protein